MGVVFAAAGAGEAFRMMQWVLITYSVDEMRNEEKKKNKKQQITQPGLRPELKSERRKEEEQETTDYLALAAPGTQGRAGLASLPARAPRLDEVRPRMDGREKREERRGRQPRP